MFKNLFNHKYVFLQHQITMSNSFS
uniref:Uncharacterized protein n=1 Tax=Anguilla anguilla TaxID=7936 RepID=A0A0E9RL97_ANGAN